MARSRRGRYSIPLAVSLLLAVEAAPAAECGPPRVVASTVVGMKYIFFDGRPASPAEIETEVSPGYEHR